MGNANDTLRGQSYISNITNDGKPRDCYACEYSDQLEGTFMGCRPPEEQTHPKELFKLKKEKILPILDGKTTGNYCPCFKRYDFQKRL